MTDVAHSMEVLGGASRVKRFGGPGVALNETTVEYIWLKIP